jgi:hypothetical protein
MALNSSFRKLLSLVGHFIFIFIARSQPLLMESQNTVH